jgi:hypothetical protein
MDSLCNLATDNAEYEKGWSSQKASLHFVVHAHTHVSSVVHAHTHVSSAAMKAAMQRLLVSVASNLHDDVCGLSSDVLIQWKYISTSIAYNSTHIS